MGSVYRRIEKVCLSPSCRGKRGVRLADCIAAGHAIEERKSKVWTIQYVRAGKVYKESTRSARNLKSDAEARLRELEGDIQRGLPVAPRMNKFRFAEAADNIQRDYKSNGKKSADSVERRLRLHLTPAFGDWLMANITTSDIRAYIEKRQEEGASNAAVNRDLAILKRMFNLAIQDGKLALKPHVPMLREDNVRQGFFERDQYESVMKHLPADVRPVVQFAYITGWRVQSEVLPLQWRNVDFAAGEIRLDAGTTKNREPRVFPMTAELRALLERQHAEHEMMKKGGRLVPSVFPGSVQEGHTLRNAWVAACKLAGCPGRILHDLRRTAVRNFVRSGIPERVAMTMTGHKTRSVFERYNIVSGGDLKDAALKLDAAASTAALAEKQG
jgi:integrase